MSNATYNKKTVIHPSKTDRQANERLISGLVNEMHGEELTPPALSEQNRKQVTQDIGNLLATYTGSRSTAVKSTQSNIVKDTDPGDDNLDEQYDNFRQFCDALIDYIDKSDILQDCGESLKAAIFDYRRNSEVDESMRGKDIASVPLAKRRIMDLYHIMVREVRNLASKAS